MAPAASRLATDGVGEQSEARRHSGTLRDLTERMKMTAYSCDKCGMSIGTMTCGECGQDLVHTTLTMDDGSSVHVSKCPDDHGMVKSPMCCGQDMTCPI